MRGASLIRAAFDQVQVPTIGCFKRATVPLGYDLGKLVDAMQSFVDDRFVTVWHSAKRRG